MGTDASLGEHTKGHLSRLTRQSMVPTNKRYVIGVIRPKSMLATYV